MTTAKNLPIELVYKIIDELDIDTRRAFKLKPKRLNCNIINNMDVLFDKIPKPVLYTMTMAMVMLGPLRDTYMHINLEPEYDSYRKRHMYVLNKYAVSGCPDNYYLECVQYMKRFDTPPEIKMNYLEYFDIHKENDDWIYYKWDGSLEHYKTSYKGKLNLPIRWF